MYNNKNRQSNNNGKIKEQKIENIKSIFKLVPYKNILQKSIKEKLHIDNNVNNKLKNNSEKEKCHILNYPRNLLSINGKIEFCLNIRKSYPNNYILFGVYGTIIKITKGKYRFQYLILLRNDSGPVLQVILYNLLSSPQFMKGEKVYCVGRFIGQSNQMQIYKIKHILEIPNDEILNRIRNVCNFSLKKINSQT